MYFIISLIVLICLLLFIRFRPKNSNIGLFKRLNEFFEDITCEEEYIIIGFILLFISLLWVIVPPLLVLSLVVHIFIKLLKKVIDKGS